MCELGLSSASAYKEHVKYTSTANWSMTATHCNMPHFVARPCLEMYWQSDTRVSIRAGKNPCRAQQSLLQTGAFCLFCFNKQTMATRREFFCWRLRFLHEIFQRPHLQQLREALSARVTACRDHLCSML